MKINKTISKEKFLDNFFKNHPRGSWLDLGCVSDDPENLIKNNHWLHAILIRESNNNCLGVDFQQENVKKLQEKGYNIIWGDVEKPLEITEKFDYIFIGELIEHVTNVHALLKNCKERLKDGGKVILTTPNAYNYRRSYLILMKY